MQVVPCISCSQVHMWLLTQFGPAGRLYEEAFAWVAACKRLVVALSVFCPFFPRTADSDQHARPVLCDGAVRGVHVSMAPDWAPEVAAGSARSAPSLLGTATGQVHTVYF